MSRGSDDPNGALVRQYWIPALVSTELPERDGSPVRVRLLGENLIAFRATSGKRLRRRPIFPRRPPSRRLWEPLSRTTTREELSAWPTPCVPG